MRSEEFGRWTDQIEEEQKGWVNIAERLTSEYEVLKAENKDLLKQARQMGLISAASAKGQPDSQATMSSELARDLKEQGIECIEKVP